MELLKEIDKYKELLDLKDSLDEQTKANNKAIEEAKQRISQMMIDEECPSISRGGFKYILQEKVRYSKKSEEALLELEQQEGITFFGVLRNEGLGDLIQETVNPRSLQSALKNYAEENDGELSEDLEKVVSRYDTYDIMKRKENNKAGKKKGD